MSKHAPTMIAVYVDADDSRQIEIAESAADLLRAGLAVMKAEHGDLSYDVRVEVPLLTDTTPPRLVQPLKPKEKPE